MRHDIPVPEEPARRDRHECLSSASTGSLKNMDALSPAPKAHAHEIHEKAGSILNTCEKPWPVRDHIKKRMATMPVLSA
jgi:hypothetical protein